MTKPPIYGVLEKMGLNPIFFRIYVRAEAESSHAGIGCLHEIRIVNGKFWVRLEAVSVSASYYFRIIDKGHIVVFSDYNGIKEDQWEVYFDEKGALHHEDGPALSALKRIVAGMARKDKWFWHGKSGLESFPDEIVAKIGDTVI